MQKAVRKEAQTAKEIQEYLVKLNSVGFFFSFPPESLRREEVNENDRLMFRRHNLIILAAVKKKRKENVANNSSVYGRVKKKCKRKTHDNICYIFWHDKSLWIADNLSSCVIHLIKEATSTSNS